MKLTLALLIGLAALAESAHAGIYDVWSCAGPTWGSAPTTAWRAVSLSSAPPVDRCPAAMGMRAEFSGSPVPDGGTTGWWFEAPPATEIIDYELYRSARSGIGPDGSSRAYALYHDEPRWDPGGPTLIEFCATYIQGCAQTGEPSSGPIDPDNRVVRENLHVRRLILRMECWKQSAGECGTTDSPGGLVIGRARIGLSDDVPPVLGTPTGTLTEPGAVLVGVQAVSASASDEGGGVARFAIVMDGATVAEQALHDVHSSCRAPYFLPVPCPEAVSRSFAFDTKGVANGRHSVQVAVVDAAGNRTLSPAIDVHVANGASANGVGASRRAQLTAAFERRLGQKRGATATVGFRSRRAVTGRLTDGLGRPIGDARIAVLATTRRVGATSTSEGMVET